MNADEYLTKVGRTIATHGHRGVREFEYAAMASHLAGTSTPPAQADLANKVKRAIKNGLQSYVPGAQWFEPVVAVEYATLTSHDDFTA